MVSVVPARGTRSRLEALQGHSVSVIVEMVSFASAVVFGSSDEVLVFNESLVFVSSLVAVGDDGPAGCGRRK